MPAPRSAYTPVIKFEMDAVKIDLIFARVNNSKWLTEQREKMAAAAAAGALADGGGDDAAAAAAGDGTGEERTEMRVDDSVLVGLDETSVRSVNGVRVAQFLLDAVGGRPDRVENFRLTLRAVKVTDVLPRGADALRFPPCRSHPIRACPISGMGEGSRAVQQRPWVFGRRELGHLGGVGEQGERQVIGCHVFPVGTFMEQSRNTVHERGSRLAA